MEERNYVVYMHKNKINGKVYIGITKQDVKKRWSGGYGYVKNKYFYSSIKKYGWDDGFEHIILFEKFTLEEANKKEMELIKYYDSTNPEKGYNITLGGDGTKGHKMSEESKNKCRESCKGKYVKGKNPSAKKVICENKIFDCIKDCAEYYDIKYTTMKSWLNHNHNMPKEWHDKGLHKLDENIENYEIQHGISGENNVKSIPVYCENKKFSNARELADYYELNYKTIKNWVNGYNPMPKEWYDKGLRREDKTMSDYKIQVPQFKKVFCENKIFNTIKECAEYYGVNKSTMQAWLSGRNVMPNKYKNKGLCLI